MAVLFKSAANATTTDALTTTVAKPVGAVETDLLVAIHFTEGPSDDMTPPPGWAPAAGSHDLGEVGAGRVWYRFVDSADAAVTDYTFGNPQDSDAAISVACFSGVEMSLPVSVLTWDSTNIDTPAHVAPSITPIYTNSMLVSAWCTASPAATHTYTPPAGMTEFADLDAGQLNAAMAYQQLTGTGATGPRTATSTITEAYISLSLLLTPDGAIGGVSGAEEIVSWIDPSGGSTPLEVEWALEGRFMPPVAFETEAVPRQAGLRLRQVRHQDRSFTVPIWLIATNEGQLRQQLRDLAFKMDPTRGPGYIRVITPTGDQRQIECRYESGLELDEKLGDTSGFHAQKAALQFRAFDPYWQDANLSVFEFTIGEVKNFFPFFPIRLTSSEVFANTSVTNLGDVQTWPVWEIFGPGENPNIINETTSRRIELPITLAAGESIRIDTRPGIKSIRHSNGDNLFPILTNVSSLWPLAAGQNAIRIEMTDAVDTSKVLLTYRTRYLTV